MRASKKWLNATFLTDCENLWVFIRSDAHAVRAGIKLKGQPPLNNPGVYRQAGGRKRRLAALFVFYMII